MEFGPCAHKFLLKILQLFLKTNTWVLRKVYVFIAVTESWFTLIYLPTCHETLNMEKGETVCFTTSWSSSSHSSSTCHHVLPVKSFLLSFHCLHFYRPTCSQAKAFFVHEWELGQRPPKGPAQEAGLTSVSLLSLSSSHPAHNFLPVSCHKLLYYIVIVVIIIIKLFCCLLFVFFFHRNTVWSSNSHFIFLKLCCFRSLLWISFPYNFFLSFPEIFSFSEAHLTLSGFF